MTIDDFYNDFRQELFAKSGAKANFNRSAFVEHMCDLLVEQGFFTEYAQTDFKITQKGQAVDAWALEEEFSTLHLLIADYREDTTPQTLTNTEIQALFTRLVRFFDACRAKAFVQGLDESMPVTKLAWLVFERKKEIKKVSLTLLSNAKVSSRVDSLPSATLDDLETTYEVWDLGRLHRLESSGKEREQIEVNLETLHKGGLPCLPASSNGGGIEAYLLVVPGPILASLYLEHGERLFEQNVRTFLQFRGKVNKGIRTTIQKTPEMFFPYNNGISATAEEVTTTKDRSRILTIKNLQIVNGGQTTASIFTAQHKEGADLSKVHVQMKLSVIPAAQIADVVPRISEFANTQNKVNAADFFANHKFHLRIEDFSRRIYAPSKDGGVRQTKWFYERARGQYVNAQASLSGAEVTAFLLTNPRDQMLTKTDLAKYILTFEEKPDVVSLGAQKAFAGTPKAEGFASAVSKKWDETEGTWFNERWYKIAIAKTIFFRELDALILQQEWYTGYKANIVTYTLAKFAQMVRLSGAEIDFLKIWGLQTLPPAIINELTGMAEKVAKLIVEPPPGTTGNPSEWAKYPACWTLISESEMSLPRAIKPFLVDNLAVKEGEQEASRQQVIQDGILAQTTVVTKGAAYWGTLREWNEKNRKLSALEMGVLDAACQIPRKIPSDKQALILLKAEKRVQLEGFR